MEKLNCQYVKICDKDCFRFSRLSETVRNKSCAKLNYIDDGPKVYDNVS